MRYLTLATDYDGTLAKDGQVDDATLAALHHWRHSGRRLILISGRQLEDFLAIFPQVDLFDLVVVENGAVLYDPVTKATTLLAEPPPPEFVNQLRSRIQQSQLTTSTTGEFSKLIQAQNELVSMGRAIVATWQPYDITANELIQAMGLPLQVILNKNAVMILPQGIDKAIGLKASAEVLKLDLAQVVGVGDAENDITFLELCGFSAAVANALPEVKQQVDWVASASRGAGVVELIAKVLAEDLEV
jgi:hypothetical protein